MLERLTALFQRKIPQSAPLPAADARLALGTLLVRVAMADNSYLFEEIEEIDRILMAAHGLKPLEAAKMRALCEKLARALPPDHDMTELIRAAVSHEHRLAITKALWNVAMADGLRDERELAIIELVEQGLGVARPDQEAARAAASIP
jgi:uncharacterized tellurite resistance protein B-like protein